MASNSNNSQYLTPRGPNNSYSFIFLGCSILLWIVSSTKGAPITTTTETISYVTKIGYLSTTSRDSAKGLDAKTRTLTLKDCKKFTGVNITGRLDDETKHFMTLLRSAAPAIVNVNSLERLKRYVLHKTKLKESQLTYRIHNFPQNLPKDIVEHDIARAFDIWSNVTGLTFTEKNKGSAHVNISFFEGMHGDGKSFDGPGGELGHAFFPGSIFEGRVHFDAAENWTSQSEHGYNLFQVAVHEFGHMLGLHHSNVPAAIMSRSYRKYDPNFQLDEDDIRGIQLLYGIYDVVPTTLAVIKEAIQFLSNQTKINL